MRKLFLEGGAQRGIFTSGVLDTFMHEGIVFDEVYGISAGGLHAVSYVSNDYGRDLKQTLMFSDDSRYMGVRNFAKDHSIFGWQFMLETIPEEYLSFDREHFINNPMKMFVGAYECETGETKFFPVYDCADPVCHKYLRASCTLPLLSELCEIDGKHYADGGVKDSFAFSQYKEGDQAVFVLTRESLYLKNLSKKRKVLDRIYQKYPQLVKDWENRPTTYNETLLTIRSLANKGEVIALCPSRPPGVSRMEKNMGKLKALYDDGVNVAKAHIEEVKEYLK